MKICKIVKRGRHKVTQTADRVCCGLEMLHSDAILDPVYAKQQLFPFCSNRLFNDVLHALQIDGLSFK